MRPIIASLAAALLIGQISASRADAKATEQTLNTAATQHATAQATYLGNEGLLIENGASKVLFDPFFHNSFNTYSLVPEDIRQAMFSGRAPYDNITAIFVSHAHGDHFAADDLVKYLKRHPKTYLVAPKQAIEQLDFDDEPVGNIVAIDIAYQDPPLSRRIGSIHYDVVRIPHAGWPQRSEVSNLLFRVTLADSLTVIHMGDADPNDEHFASLSQHWNKSDTNVAFPPYWFFVSRQGPMILKDRIKANRNIGIHVPLKVPFDLYQSGRAYFTEPGEAVRLD